MIRRLLKNFIPLRVMYATWLASAQYFRFRPVAFLYSLWWYTCDYRRLKKNKNDNFILSPYHVEIYLDDKTSFSPLEPIYFLQNNWATKKILEIKPSLLVDIGSSVNWLGMISQFVPVSFVDIRPVNIKIEEIQFIKGTITNLPFETDSIECISSLCVIEHIGLGRYGDSIDANGSEKAVDEMIRVTQSGGTILISVPVDSINRIYFNAHRAFTRTYILELFKDCELCEEKYIYGNKIENEYKNEFGTGLFYFRKL